MEFKGRYLFAMRSQAPKMFVALCRSGQLEQHVQGKGLGAHAFLDELLADEPKGVDGLPRDVQALRLAEESALAELLDFPSSKHDKNV